MADPSSLPPLPADHLNHPESWATGGDPATEKQKGFVKVLEAQHPDLLPENGLKVADMGKSEASAVIDQLKSGKKLESGNKEENGASSQKNVAQVGKTNGTSEDEKVAAELDEQVEEMEKEEKIGEKRTRQVANGEETEDGDSATESAGKDLKRTKQTTLDGSVGSDVKGTDATDEKQVRERKKARVDDKDDKASTSSSRAEEIPRPVNPLDKDTPKSSDADNIDPNQIAPQLSSNEKALPSASTEAETTPGDDEHLDHPENWATGYQPATDKQKGFLKVLEKQKGASVEGNVDGMGKSEASEKIDELKNL
ncbi:MAG: hypothetical protein TREMPRED_004983 [Tremellales sp. Tagirdzhanova-0007]|nr:MAG: hypothetical protein TREMPRED_004983 [Tremellales sp. Tagirdzhanova-0007]